MRASAPTKDSSSATASGSCSATSSWTPLKIVSNRAAGRSRADVCHWPWAIARRTVPPLRPSPVWTIPYPHAAVPGSMPRTFTYRRYWGPRTSTLRDPPGSRRSALAVLGRPGAQSLAGGAHVLRGQRLRRLLELLSLRGGGDLPRLEADVGEQAGVPAVRLRNGRDVVLDLVRDALGELSELLDVLGDVRSAGCGAGRRAQHHEGGDEALAVLRGERREIASVRPRVIVGRRLVGRGLVRVERVGDDGRVGAAGLLVSSAPFRLPPHHSHNHHP